MTKNTKIIIGVGLGLGIAYLLYSRNKNKNATAKSTIEMPIVETEEESSNASGEQIGTQPCSSSNASACTKACADLGGTYDAGGDRKCYKNGIAISGGLFGGSRNRSVSSRS